MKNKSYKSAFTIVEMLIVVPIVIMVIGVFIGAIVSMTGEVLATRANNSMAYNIQDAIDRIRQDVSMSGGFLATNNITLTSPQGYNNDTTVFKNADATNGTMLILNIYTTTMNPANPNRGIVYASSQPNQCDSSLVTKNSPVMMNVIYFTKTDIDGNKSLWRRVVAPNNYRSISCSNPWQQPTCEVGQSGPICKTNDVKLVENISDTNGLVVEYFASSGSTSPIVAASDSAQNDTVRQTAISTANTISITIAASDIVAGRDINQSATARIGGLNNNITATVLPTACPTGFVRVPGSITYGTLDFCVMKYEAKNVGGIATSQAALTPWVSINKANAITTANAACAGCHLITESEWLTIAHNTLLVPANWTSGVIGTGSMYIGHDDSAPNNSLAAISDDSDGYFGTTNTTGSRQKRTLVLSNGEVIWDMAGNVMERTAGTYLYPTIQPGITGGGLASRDWLTITNMGTIAPSVIPSWGNSIADTWNNTNGMGYIYSNSDIVDATSRSFLRGGVYSGNNASIFSLNLNYAETDVDILTGFRVAK